MKLVIVSTGLDTGGAETMLLRLLERLDSRFSPHVVSLTSVGGVGRQIEALGIPVEALGMSPGIPPTPFAFLRMVQLLRTIRPDVVHTWMYHANFVGGLAARLAGVRAVAWGIHHSNLSPELNKYSTLVVVRACALLSRWVPNRIVNCSMASKAIHVESGYEAAKMVVLPNGFDLAIFRPDMQARVAVRTELCLGGDTPVVGLIGRFDPQKNHAGFFQAAKILHRRIPTVRFVLAGYGIEKGNLELMRMIEHAGVGHVTELLDLRSDIPRLMSALDILVSSSHGEAFPNVLGEAMACGVPCVVTNVGDSAYIVGDTGRVVKSGDMAGLAIAMEELLLMSPIDRRALGDRARERVEKYFEIGRIVRQYEEIYEELGSLRRARVR